MGLLKILESFFMNRNQILKLLRYWIDLMENPPPIRHLQLADLSTISDSERCLVRITGNVNTERTTGSELALYNTTNHKDYEVLVDLQLLDQFNLKDMHVQHDLVQFIGSRDFAKETAPDQLRFKALYYRFIRRTNLDSYYAALQVQNDYLKDLRI